MQILIYGARGFARTVAELAVDCGYTVAGMIDDHDPSRAGVLGRLDDVLQARRDCGIVLGIGYSDLPARWAAWVRVRDSGLATPALVHPRAYVARSAVLGAGAIVMAGALVDQRARIGEAAVIWPGVCISHDCALGENCFVSPNATLCGEVRIGANSFIGAAAAIADHCDVPADSRLRMLERYAKNRRP